MKDIKGLNDNCSFLIYTQEQADHFEKWACSVGVYKLKSHDKTLWDSNCNNRVYFGNYGQQGLSFFYISPTNNAESLKGSIELLCEYGMPPLSSVETVLSNGVDDDIHLGNIREYAFMVASEQAKDRAHEILKSLKEDSVVSSYDYYHPWIYVIYRDNTKKWELSRNDNDLIKKKKRVNFSKLEALDSTKNAVKSVELQTKYPLQVNGMNTTTNKYINDLINLAEEKGYTDSTDTKFRFRDLVNMGICKVKYPVSFIYYCEMDALYITVDSAYNYTQRIYNKGKWATITAGKAIEKQAEQGFKIGDYVVVIPHPKGDGHATTDGKAIRGQCFKIEQVTGLTRKYCLGYRAQFQDVTFPKGSETGIWFEELRYATTVEIDNAKYKIKAVSHPVNISTSSTNHVTINYADSYHKDDNGLLDLKKINLKGEYDNNSLMSTTVSPTKMVQIELKQQTEIFYF